MASEEEYHIPGEAQASAYQSEELSPPPKPKIDFKKVLIVVFILAIFWIGVHFVSSSKKAKKNRYELTQVEQPIAISMPVEQKPQVPTNNMMVIQKGAVNLENRLANVEEGNASVEARVQRTNASLADLQNNLAVMSSQIATLNSTLQDLVSQVTQQQSELHVLGNNQTKKERESVSKQAPVIKPQILFIQALIPGRAWLSTQEGGMSMTVKEGDAIPTYGVVNSIDPVQGVVNTSSGRTIVFRGEE
ncbi:MAG: IcmG (DotF) [uncultured bacterium]|nr:MAG: IcmG (DotF) [uncultured bacterium]OGT16078.1 MAG: hypothetical protein A3B69_00595 [Gammaproteobacteria bacterium RIFCSPHIGHO2_02_FULL_38_33]OGT77785.1 MAG: hypothetical protein A3G71_06070 [Gammaproteobacteria bacterium RIFCSPLOWO2_12_FULL_38_14]